MSIDPDGVMMMLIFGIVGIVCLALAGLLQVAVKPRRPRYTVTRVDYARCERTGSQASFVRRLRARGGV